MQQKPNFTHNKWKGKNQEETMEGNVTYILIFMLCVSSVLCVWAGLPLVCRPVESVRDYRRLHIAELFWGLVTSDITQGARSDSMSTTVLYILSFSWQLKPHMLLFATANDAIAQWWVTLCWKFEHFSASLLRTRIIMFSHGHWTHLQQESQIQYSMYIGASPHFYCS